MQFLSDEIPDIWSPLEDGSHLEGTWCSRIPLKSRKTLETHLISNIIYEILMLLNKSCFRGCNAFNGISTSIQQSGHHQTRYIDILRNHKNRITNTSCDIMRLFFPNLAEEPGRQVLAGFVNHQTIPLGRQSTERNQSKIHKWATKKTIIAFHYTGCLIGIPIIGYNKPLKNG